MRRFLLIVILLQATATRLTYLPQIPPLKNEQDILLRVVSVGASIISVWCIYKIVNYYKKNQRIALLSALMFSVFPWTIEQGRIISEQNIVLSVILGILYLQTIVRGKKKYGLCLLFPIAIYLFYPSIWVLNTDNVPQVLQSIKLQNVLFFTSTEILFFENPTFWWGGVREWGISLSLFAPFLIGGIIRLLINKNFKLLITTLSIILLAALSPKLPESREFYLITPILSFFIADGLTLLRTSVGRPLVWYTVLLIATSIFVYEYQNFMHFYATHYKDRVKNNLEKIIGRY